MGKGGKGKSKKQAADDDALLEAAIAENLRLKEQESKAVTPSPKAMPEATAAAGARRLTQKEIVTKLDSNMLMNIVCNYEGKKQQVPGPDGVLTWYADAVDAKAALEELVANMPSRPEGMELGLDFTPMGRAFALSEGWFNIKTGAPMRLQASRRVLAAYGEQANTLPAQLRAKMNQRTGSFPLFSLEELQTDSIMPFFFNKEDLISCWLASGKTAEELPSQLTMTDLRTLVVRTLTESDDWMEKLTLVPPQGMVDLMEKVDGLIEQLEQVAKMTAEATGKVVAEAREAHAAAVAAGDEPPPLM